MASNKGRDLFVGRRSPPPSLTAGCDRESPESGGDAVTRWFPSGAVEGRPRRIKASRGLEREVAPCFQLIHLLPDVASHLSWLETAHRPGILMTAALHPSSSLPTAPHIISNPPPPRPHRSSLYVFALHTLYILSAQLISCLPIFTPPCRDSFPRAAALCQPNFLLPFSAPLVSRISHPSQHVTSLSLPCCLVYHLSSTLSDSISPSARPFPTCVTSNSSSHLPFTIALRLPLVF